MFPHRRPSPKAREAMSRSAEHLGEETCCRASHKEINRCIKGIKDIVGQKFVKPVSSGNCAILAVASAIPGKFMIPDQGGWRGFKDYPELMGREVCTLKTELGVVSTDTLEGKLRKEKPAALFLTSFAGYIAEQNIREIFKICQENSVILIEDVSGGIGDRVLARGNSDITICSTGAPKILNVFSGGFISTSEREILDMSMEVISACKVSPVTCAGIREELKIAPKIVDELLRYSAMLKEELDGVIHRTHRGLGVGIRVADPKNLVKSAREKGLVTDLNQGILTACPRYDRFLENGVVIELKKLDILKVTEDDIAKIAEILKT